MSLNRYAARRDENEPEIIKALEQIGASVMQLDKFDILVGIGGKDYKMEIKTKDGRLTKSQKVMMQDWAGTPLYVVRSVSDALRVLGFSK